jgi:phage/plasmid primase-like uncharacterized protein
MKCSMPVWRASSTTWWINGRSTTGSISLGIALVAARNRVPRSATAARLAPAAKMMGVAEGIETSLAAAHLHELPVWAALSDRGVETFEPPADVERLIIFGDNDTNRAGQRAAYALAARVAQRVKVEIKIPEVSGTDWNDVIEGEEDTQFADTSSQGRGPPKRPRPEFRPRKKAPVL